MSTMIRTPLLAALGIAAGMLAAAPAMAETVKMSATLEAAQEVPPNDSTGSGMVDATFDTESKKLDWTVEYTELSGPATAAHFHGPAGPGENAPPMVPVSGDLASPLKGSATLTDEQAAALTEGKIYFNLHTAAHPDGEVRGQLEKSAM
jgi:hypothetical protein